MSFLKEVRTGFSSLVTGARWGRGQRSLCGLRGYDGDFVVALLFLFVSATPPVLQLLQLPLLLHVLQIQYHLFREVQREGEKIETSTAFKRPLKSLVTQDISYKILATKFSKRSQCKNYF